MENGFNVGQGIRSLIFIIIGLIFITPLLWMVSTSFKFESQVFEKPFVFFHWGQLNFENYRNIWLNTPFLTWLYNSIFVVVFSVVFRLIIAAFGGYSFGFLKFKYSGSIFFLFLMTLFVPYQLTLLPQFIAFRFVHLLDTRWALIIPNILDILSIFMMRQFFLSFPRELISAAYMEGSGITRSFWKVALPLAKVPLITLGILSFFMIWDQFYQPLIFLKSKDLYTIPMGLQSFQTQFGKDYAQQMALACLAIVPVLTVFLILQKQFIESVTSSGIKG
ncbi:ABC transporter permease subunit [Paenibacillus sp. LMG 31458]|uniref:ABC transporter permease subunit n=2 Tax=Paenibacillus TaxID=44249 RepID=A0ABX1Z603_9BACL|nr:MULTISPECIES: carbohydrate ABC transporter permease [Paenibacillus]NOU74784.1 ABC transporter permease subunit [Paenibacillus phytorum]NOU88244.1 ABC transporter permease subunit [Paenibacillus germinis]